MTTLPETEQPEGGMTESGKPDRELFRFLYQRYQMRLENLESGALKVTLAVLVMVAGLVAVGFKASLDNNPDGADIRSAASLVLDILYRTENAIFIALPVFYATWFSLWSRYRALYAVAKLILLEEKFDLIGTGLAYWVGRPKRGWAYVCISPWPWIFLTYTVGAILVSSPLLPSILVLDAIMGGLIWAFFTPAMQSISRPEETMKLEEDRILRQRGDV